MAFRSACRENDGNFSQTTLDLKTWKIIILYSSKHPLHHNLVAEWLTYKQMSGSQIKFQFCVPIKILAIFSRSLDLDFLTR